MFSRIAVVVLIIVISAVVPNAARSQQAVQSPALELDLDKFPQTPAQSDDLNLNLEQFSGSRHPCGCTGGASAKQNARG